MVNLYEELSNVIAALDAAGVPYSLCGALALAVHGAPRATKDLDIIAPRDHEAELRTAVRAAGFVFDALPMEFPSKIEVQRFTKLVDGRPLMLDVLWAGGPLAGILARRQRVPWREGTIWVVSREDLITLKITAGRPQDLVDVQTLAALEGRHDKG